jgi:hypothetical protein
MAEQKIQLRKLRDFGENFNDTFLFLRQNFKPLLRSFFAISSIVMVGLAIFYGINQSRSFSVLGSVFKGTSRTTDPYNNLFTIEYFMLMLFMLLTFITMEVVLGAYIKYYLENDGKKPGIDEVWGIFKRYFLKILLYSIPFSLVTLLGVLFCIAPGVYLWVLFTPFPLIVMIEDKDFVETYDRCLELLRDNFWISFAIYLVAYMIFYISHGIFDGISAVILGVTAYFSTEDVSTTIGIATSFVSIFSYCFYVVYFVSVALQYFSLVEKHDGTGLMSRIENIGRHQSGHHNTEEHY